ncbi:MAG TPA: aminotransferase class V-fold PLP-dependent enzyme [Bacillota bacterium]|nr:aminotransferase class V-fold PLP-dependent enzyme [Bacillota bacterium]
MGLLKPGDHVITSSVEHNAVSRPLHYLAGNGVEITKIPATSDGGLEADQVEQAVKPNTRAVVVTHASNVSGALLPVREIGQVARSHNLAFIVDAAQTAGVFDIDVEEMNIDFYLPSSPAISFRANSVCSTSASVLK